MGERLQRPPGGSEYAPYYAGYVGHVPESDVIAVLELQVSDLQRFGARIPAARETFRYEPGKWSIRQVFGHLVDADRVFGFRLLTVRALAYIMAGHVRHHLDVLHTRYGLALSLEP